MLKVFFPPVAYGSGTVTYNHGIGPCLIHYSGGMSKTVRSDVMVLSLCKLQSEQEAGDHGLLGASYNRLSFSIGSTAQKR